MKDHHECSEHEHEHKNHCCCCGSSSHSHEESCHHHSDCHESHDKHDFAHKLIELADHAWMEVLLEELKAEIRTNQGAHLKELAKQVSSTNSERWKHKMALEKINKEFKEKLCHLFNNKC